MSVTVVGTGSLYLQPGETTRVCAIGPKLKITFWVIRGGGKVILFDSGFYRDKVRNDYPSHDFMPPSAVIAELKIKPGDVTDMVISHIHNDHADGADLFPKAQVWMQREEYGHYVADALRTRKNVDGAEPVDVAALARINKSGRMAFVNGDDQEIFPGITCYIGGKHTWESQYLGVQTRRGVVVLASDNVYFFENLEKHLPITRTLDVKSNLAAQDRMKTLAASPDLIIPGHDPKVFGRFPKVSPLVVRIDRIVMLSRALRGPLIHFGKEVPVACAGDEPQLTGDSQRRAVAPRSGVDGSEA